MTFKKLDQHSDSLLEEVAPDDQCVKECAREQLEDRIEELEGALLRVQQWAEAYPVHIFIPMEEEGWEYAHDMLKETYLSLARVSADNMRFALRGVGEIARGALEEKT